MPEAMITIILNGDPRMIDSDAHLGALIAELKMRPQRIAVEINRQIVPKSDYAAHDSARRRRGRNNQLRRRRMNIVHPNSGA